jgi:hypothetical protein
MKSFCHDLKQQKIIRGLKATLQDRPLIEEKTGYILLNRKCVLAKKKQKFRLVGHIDWVKYRMADLVDAMNTDSLEQYYSNQLEKYPPDWKDKDLEKSLKQKYEVTND